MGPLSELHPQVIVAGAGPVGLFAALTLARKGIRVLVLDKADGVDSSPRAMAFQPCAIAEMIELGIFDDVQAQCIPDATISCLEDDSQKALSGLNIGQDLLSHILLKHLKPLPNVEIFWGHEVLEVLQRDTDLQVTCQFKGPDGTSTTESLSVDWLIAADGGRSSVRKLLNVPFEGFTWSKEEFVASNVYYPFEKYGFTARNFVIDGVNWAIVARVRRDGLWRVAFGVSPDETDEQVRTKLQDHYKYIFPGPATGWKLERLNKYRPHQRCVTSMRVGRVLFAGDAAHLNNPIGGLGLTTGILDVGPLGRALAAVLSGAPSSLLDKWAQSRRDTWWNTTNKQSIEFKRIAQQGGYGNDPRGIWAKDEMAAKDGILSYIEAATPEAQGLDKALYIALRDPKKQAASRARVWKLALPSDWMAEYEDSGLVKWRQSLRPHVVN